MATSAMETVGILSLPNELLYEISRYISMNDILSCSMSCYRPRSALNNDLIWKRFLHLKDLTYFEEKELPTVDVPLQENLSPLCSNRLHVMRSLKILNNWTHGRCTSEVIQKPFVTITDGRKRLSSGMSMYRDSFVFIVAEFRNFSFVELWDIKGKPFRLTHIKYQSVLKVHVVGDNLLIFHRCCRIYVHNICIKDNALPLKYVLYENLSSLSSLDNDCSHEIKLRPFWYHYVYKQFLISNYKNKILIWDIPKSKKVITYNFPHASHSIVDIKNSYGSYVLVKTYSLHGNHFKIINIFQEQSLELTQFYSRTDRVVLQDSYFVVFRSSTFDLFELDLSCSVYNVKTSQVMSQKSFRVHEYFDSMDNIKIVNGCFALIFQHSILKIVDAKTLDIIHTIECNNQFRPKIVYQLNVLSKLFVGSVYFHKFNIWNVERKVLLPSLPFLNNEDLIIGLNKWCSKVVCYHYKMGTISVLNFS